MGCHFQLQGISLAQRWNQHLFCLLHWPVDSLPCTTWNPYQWCVCIYPILLDPVSQPLVPLPQVITEHWSELPAIYSRFPLLSVLHMVVYICQCYSLNLSHPSFPTCVHMFILYIWVSTLALEIGPPYHFSRVHVYALIPDNSVGKESTCNSGDPSLIPGLGRSTGQGIGYPLQYSWASLVAQLVKNPPAMQETWVRSLGWEDTLEKGKATHSSIVA